MKFRKVLAVLLFLGMSGSAAVWADDVYSENVAQAVHAFLGKYIEGGDKVFTFDKARGIFRGTLSSKGEVRLLGFQIEIGNAHFISYFISPIGADPGDTAKMSRLAEFICRANYGMLNGNFELDFSDGEIRYKSFVDCSGECVPSEEVIGNSLWVGLNMFNRYLPGIKDMLFSDVIPKDAVEKCRK
ncbi:MAG: YbjN domain-containing protein [Fretibacterium sp.]|nr:YbjN domain-containing protein [Fretibacterium sp.]